MIVYSVTVTVEPLIETKWVEYMKKEHIPEVLATACFIEHKFLKVLSTQEEKECTYNIQYYCNSMDDLMKYQTEYAKVLQEAHGRKVGNKAYAFRTVLELL